MTSDGPEQTLPLDDAERIDALRGAFDRAWGSGATPRLEDHLDQVSDDIRLPTFREFLKVEIKHRRSRQERISPEDYLASFPAFEAAIRDLCQSAEMLETVVLVPGGVRSGLHVRCPHCHNPIELVPEAELESIHCGSCGSDFSLTSDEEKVRRNAQGHAQVGHFTLVERLGMGAFGTVWKAHDAELDRTVAVKIPRAGNLDKQRQEFFLREARSAAQLRHPNIVPVYEVGREGDTLYIVSEFIRGLPLSDWLTGQRPTARDTARVCAKIADALHHAHQAGVIHRDLKPANVMMDGDGEPHLMDFGLARREAGEITMTVEGQVLGTPAYMSPEQAGGDAHKADARSDVYSLGVILFELLTGELPFRGSPRMLLKQVMEDEPPRPRKLAVGVPRDLETICLKCLEKSPSKRYDTAQEVGEDLRRFLNGETVKARPVGRLSRSWRWCKRNPVVATSLAVGMVFIAALSYSLREQMAQQALSNKRLTAAKHETFNLALSQAAGLIAEDAYGSKTSLEDVALCPYDLRDFSWRLLRRRADRDEVATTLRHPTPVTMLRFSPDGSQLASAAAGKLLLWDTGTGKLLRSLNMPNAPLRELRYSHDGSLLFICHDDGHAWLAECATGRRVFDFTEVQCLVGAIESLPMQGFMEATKKTEFVALTSTNVSDDQSGVSIAHFDPAQGPLVAQPLFAPPRSSSESNQPSDGMTRSNDGEVVSPDEVAERKKRGQQEEGELMFLTSRIVTGDFMDHDRELVTAHEDGRLMSWRLLQVPYRATVLVRSSIPYAMANQLRKMDVTLSGRGLLPQSRGKAIHLLRANSLKSDFWVALSDGALEQWSADDSPEITQATASQGVRPQEINANGRFSGMADDHHLAIIDAATKRSDLELSDLGPVRCTGLSADGTALAVAQQSGATFIQSAASSDAARETVTDLDGNKVSALAFSPDGTVLACGCEDGKVSLWDRKLKAFRGAFENAFVGATIIGVDASPTNRYCVSVSAAGDARVWERATGKMKTTLRSEDGNLLKVLITNDEAFAVGVDDQGCAAIWDISGKLLARRLIPDANSLVRNADSSEIAIGNGNQWQSLNLKKGEITRALWTDAWTPDAEDESAALDGIAFSPRGERVAAFAIDAHQGGSTERYSVASGRGSYSELGGLFGRIEVKNWDWLSHRAAPDRRISFSDVPPYGVLLGRQAGSSPMFAVADARQMVAMGNLVYRPHAEMPFGAIKGDPVANAFSPDERLLLTLSSGGDLNMWDPLTLSLRPSWSRVIGVKSPPGVTSFSMSWDGSILALGHANGLVTVLNAGKRLAEDDDRNEPFVGFLDDGRIAVRAGHGGGYDHVVKFTDLGSGEVIDSWHGHERWDEEAWDSDGGIVYSDNGKYIAEIAMSKADDGKVWDEDEGRTKVLRIFDLARRRQMSSCNVRWKRQDATSSIYGGLTAVSGDGSRIAFAASKTHSRSIGTIYEITVMDASGRMINRIPAGFTWSLDQDLRIVAYGRGDKFYLIDVDTNRPLWVLDSSDAKTVLGTAGPIGNSHRSKLSPDGSLLAISDDDKTWILDVKKLIAGGASTPIVEIPSSSQTCAFSRDNRMVAIADGVFDTSTGRLVSEFANGDEHAYQLTFHPSGTIIAKDESLLDITHPPTQSPDAGETWTAPATGLSAVGGSQLVSSKLLRDSQNVRPVCGVSADGKWIAAAVIGPDNGIHTYYQKAMFPCTFFLWNVEHREYVAFEASLGVDLSGSDVLQNSLSVSANGQFLALRGFRDHLWVVDTKSQAVVRDFQIKFSAVGQVSDPKFTPDERTISYYRQRFDIASGEWTEIQPPVPQEGRVSLTRHAGEAEGPEVTHLKSRFHLEVADKLRPDWFRGSNRHLVLRSNRRGVGEVLRLVFGADGRWLAMTPDGHYDASDHGKVSWAWFTDADSGINLPLAALRDKLYSPGLLQKVLRGESIAVDQPVTVGDLRDAAGSTAVYAAPIQE